MSLYCYCFVLKETVNMDTFLTELSNQSLTFSKSCQNSPHEIVLYTTISPSNFSFIGISAFIKQASCGKGFLSIPK